MLSYRGYSVLKGLVHTIAEVKSANRFCLSYIFSFLSRTCFIYNRKLSPIDNMPQERIPCALKREKSSNSILSLDLGPLMI